MAKAGPPPPRALQLLGLLLVPLAALTVLLVGFHSIIEEDFWWHVKVGAEILSGEGIPRVDHYSYPSAGRPYVDLHWLFQILLHLTYRTGGEAGVIWAKCLLAVGIFAIVYRLARRAVCMPVAALLVALGAIVSSERILARPEIVSFLLLATTLWLLRRHEEGMPRAWQILPVVTLLWVNVEGLFVLGFAAIGAHLAGRLRDGRLWASLGLSVLASLANPYFVTGAVHPFVLFSRINGSLQIYSMTIGEFLSPFERTVPHPAVTVFPYYLALLGAAILLYGRRPRVSEVILIAAFGYLALAARRNLALFAIVATPILARWVGEGIGRAWIRALWNRIAVRGRMALAAGTVLVPILAMGGYDLALVNGAVYNASGTNRRFGTAPAPVAFPKGAARFLAANRISGPIFNLLSAGGYLIHAYPEEKVFIDGRLEVHSTGHYGRYLGMLAGGDAWKRAEREFGFRCLVLNYAEAIPLTLDRLGEGRWETVYLDDTAIVLVRRVPENEDLIERHRITRETLLERYPSVTDSLLDRIPRAEKRSLLGGIFHGEPYPWSETYLGQFFGVLGLPGLAAYQYATAVEAAPHNPAPRFLLADALRQGGDPEAAKRVLAEAGRLRLSRSGRATLEERLRALRK